MVDFSDREEIKRWLDGIESGKAAARGRYRTCGSRHVARHAAARQSHDERASQSTYSFVLSSLRATALTWAAGKYPAHGSELRAAAAHAAAVLYETERLETELAVLRAKAALEVADQLRIGELYLEIERLRDRQRAAHAAAFAADAAFIDSGLSGSKLAGLPLWPTGAPDWATEKLANPKGRSPRRQRGLGSLDRLV